MHNKVIYAAIAAALIFTAILVWSAHDAREQTTKRFTAAVGAGFSCSVNYTDACEKITPVKAPSNADKRT